MKKITRRVLSFAGALVLAALPSTLQAHPYASGVTNISGTVQFILNESGGNVTVLFDNSTVTNVLGVLPSGLHTFAAGAHTNYSIVVTKSGAGSVTQVSVDTTNNSFFGPRGIAVNMNPQTVNFGRVYVVNASGGTGTAPAQTVGRGVYILNADTSDALGNFSTPATAGLTLGSSTTYSPWKIFVGPDDMVYVGDSTGGFTGTPGTASVAMCDPSITVNTPILSWAASGTFGGCQSQPVVTGSLAAGNLQLYCFEWGYSSITAGLTSTNNYCYLYDYTVGGTAPCTATPTILMNPDITNAIANIDGVVMDACLAPDGKWFAAMDRANSSAGQCNLFVYASDGLTPLWNSLTAIGKVPGTSGTDPCGSSYAVTVSKDDKFVAAVNGSTGAIYLMNLTNGVPDMSTLTTTTTALSGTCRSLCFDAADNLYVTSGGIDRVREYSLGLTTTATTYNDLTGTNGAFSISIPPNTVTMTAITNQASQTGPKSGVFKIARSAGLGLSAPLTVTFVLSGTATNGTYTCSPAGIVPVATNTVVIAANQLSTNITITPVNDGLSRPTTTVVAALQSGTNYSAVFPTQDTVYIQNTGPQFVFISAVLNPIMYNAYSNDYCSFTLTRWGNTNASAYAVTFTSGAGATAVQGVDYTAPTTLTFNPGDITHTEYIYPLTSGQLPVDSSANPYVGNKTAIVVPASGSYTAGTNQAVLGILDSAYPTTALLWSDSLTDPNDATNWEVMCANNNMASGPVDNTIEFGYDLQNGDPTDNGAIPLPPNGATTALRVTCNKTDNSVGSQGAAAGVNLYPTNVTFSGNYAVRFSMNLIQGHDYAVTTEGAMFGINHSGQATNWWSGSSIASGWDGSLDYTTNWESDGVWYWCCADIGTEEYQSFTGLGGSLPNTGWSYLGAQYVTPFLNAFNTNVFTGGTAVGSPGLISNGSVISNLNASSWADVEIRQINNQVTMSINKTVVFTTVNTNTFTSGTLMLGYDDPYNSVGTLDAAVYYSNIRVVSVTSPYITQIALNPVNSTAVINFTTTDGDATPTSFTLQSSANVAGPYTAAVAATITELSAGAFQAVVPESGSIEFYRIQQNN